MEDPDTRPYASEDPRGFLNEYRQNVILDEVQRVPQLLSYMQTIVIVMEALKSKLNQGKDPRLFSTVTAMVMRLILLFKVAIILPRLKSSHPKPGTVLF